MEVAELVAREGVRETVARYSHYADGGRFAELSELFADDGVLEVKGRPPAVGRPAIVAFVSAVKADQAPPFIRHHTSALRIDLAPSGDEASAACYFMALTDIGLDHWGRYRDRLVRDGDRWLFAHRLVGVDGITPGSRFS
jgi:SnoaL-like domain